MLVESRPHFGLPVVGLMILLFVALAACADQEELESTRSISATASASTSPSPSTPPNPILTETGIRVSILAEFDVGAPPFVPVCEAEGYVSVLDGIVVEKGTGFPASEVTVGEPVYHLDGSQYSGGTLLSVPAYRDDDGRLIGEWRKCEDAPEPGLDCEEDGRAWVFDGRVTEVVTQTSGKSASVGEEVFGGPDEVQLSGQIRVLMPVYRGSDGKLLFGWSKCVEESPSQ